MKYTIDNEIAVISINGSEIYIGNVKIACISSIEGSRGLYTVESEVDGFPCEHSIYSRGDAALIKGIHLTRKIALKLALAWLKDSLLGDR